MQEVILAARSATAPEFWFWLVILSVLSVLLGKAAIRRLRRAHIVEDIPTSRVRSASQGYIELQGHSEALPGQPVVAPLTGSHCCWWSFRIEEKVAQRRRGGSEVSWQHVSHGTSEELFALADGSGTCVIDPWGAEVMTVSQTRWYGDQRHPAPGMRKRRYGGKYRYSEKRLDIGGPLYAIGWFRTERAIVETGPLAEEIRALLAHWKRDQPGLLARFDTNRDGNIDLEEWEVARQAALLEVTQARQTRSAEPGLDVLSHPPDKRPYLLAALPQPQVARRLRGYALAFALLAIGLCSLGIYLVAARFY